MLKKLFLSNKQRFAILSQTMICNVMVMGGGGGGGGQGGQWIASQKIFTGCKSPFVDKK